MESRAFRGIARYSVHIQYQEIVAKFFHGTFMPEMRHTDFQKAKFFGKGFNPKCCYRESSTATKRFRNERISCCLRFGLYRHTESWWFHRANLLG